jgi:tetratricopeptide (TPR) repeat protein
MIRLKIIVLALILVSLQLPSSAIDQSCDWSTQFDSAMRLRAEGKLKEAISVLQILLRCPLQEKDSKNLDQRQYGETLYATYSIYMMLGDWHDAAGMFKRAEERDSHTYAGHIADMASDLIELGNCHYQLKDFKSAAACYEKGLAMRLAVYGKDSPYIGAVQWRYAKVLRTMGEWQQAAKLVNESYSTLPYCGHCRNNEGVCPIYYGEKSYVISPREFIRMDYFDGGKHADPGSPHFWCTKCNRLF